MFHALTDESTIRRELLLHEGEPYRTQLADESMRNLRGLGILALVRVVPLATEEPDRVDVLVYTRDLWSLRLEQEFAGAGGSFELGAQLIERNFLGRDKALAGRFSLAPYVYTFGQTYTDRRLFGEELALSESFDVVFNRETGKPEGSEGGVYFGRPFYTIAQRFSFELNLAYGDFIRRGLRDGRVAGVDTRAGTLGDPCAIGPDEYCVPYVYDLESYRADASIHQRVGVKYTQTFSAGMGLLERRATPNRETILAESQRRVFAERILPRSRRDVYPFLGYRLSLPRYRVFTNLATFGLSETVQVGPRLKADVSFPLEALGSTSSGLSLHGSTAFVWAEQDALAEAAAEGWTRLDRGDVVDQRLVLQLRAAGPSWPWLWGRLVFRWYLDVHHNDTQRTEVTLGGDNGLRGYKAQQLYLLGASRMLWNFEYRTRPWLLQSIHVGLVLFYDAGSVNRRVADMSFHHGVGAGLRVLFPQFNRYAFRLDLGHAVGEPGFSVLFTYGSDQVVPLTPAEDAAAATGLGPSLR